MLDIKVVNAQLLDGTGSQAVRTDVGVSGDTIADIGDLAGAEARTVVDASGKYVCPGFIDVHSHSDAYLIIEPLSPSKIHQGITTEVIGNCGASAAPRSGMNEMPSDWLDKKYPARWSTVAEFRALVEQARPGPNVVMLIGHNALRSAVSGHVDRRLDAAEQDRMLGLFEQSLDEGAHGLSTGLIYSPGMFAPADEIVALARVAARRGGIYTSHMRSESKDLLIAIEEALQIGRSAGIRVEISHLKTSGKANWGLLDKALGLIRTARSNGEPVCADRYPYTAASTDLDILLPKWVNDGGKNAILRRLRDPASRAKVRGEILASRSPDYWGIVTVASTNHPDNLRFQGRKLLRVAEELHLEPVDAALHLIETDNLKTQAFFFGMSEDNMTRILAEPYVMIGSDASLRSLTGQLSKDFPHPRAYGSFPRFLRMALDGRTVPLAEAVRKMTSLPAGHFGLANRGILRKGMKADIVVFDPTTVADLSSYENPHQLSVGLDCVIVNGTPTIAQGRPTGNRAGRVL
ncbi:MAG: hypothetical protein C0404_03485 [Verrucomicrobia bacterium]|nr:hypothetical protein [Verrucomicrobiota bacterium]